MYHLLYHSFFVFRRRYCYKFTSLFRKAIFGIQGMRVGPKTNLPKLFVTWPHQVVIGGNCVLEHGIYFKYDGIYAEGPSIRIEDDVFIGSYCEFNCTSGIRIGRYSKIASGSRFIDHDHGIQASELIRSQLSIDEPIVVEEDVWIGCNVVVLKGTTIGKGAVIGAGAVVTKSVPPYEIWAGVPAKKIGERK